MYVHEYVYTNYSFKWIILVYKRILFCFLSKKVEIVLYKKFFECIIMTAFKNNLYHKYSINR